MSTKLKSIFGLAGVFVIGLTLFIVQSARAVSFAPGTFGKLSPKPGSVNQRVNITLDWSDSGEATSYEYCIDTVNDNVCAGWASAGANSWVLVNGLSYDTTYYWQVRAINLDGITYANYPASYWSFKTGSPPSAFFKTGPINGTINQPTSLNLTWGASSSVNYYEYCVDTTNDNACSPWATNGVSNNKSLTGLTPNTTYYWHVRAVNTIGITYAGGSSTDFWFFTTGTIPGAFAKTSPSNGSVSQLTTLDITWSASFGATSYDVCYDTVNDNTCTAWLSNGASTTRTLSGLTPGITYFWQVRAINSFGTVYADGNATVHWSFKTGSPPSTPVLISPVNNALSYILTPTFDWNNSTLPGLGDFKYYELQIDVSNTFATAVTYTTSLYNINDSSFTLPTDLARATLYYWRVRSLNTLDEASAWSEKWSVRIAYAPPTLLTPANFSIGVALKPLFTWNPVPGATSYNLQISRSSYFNILALNVTVTSASYTTATNLLRNTQYFWRLRINGLFGPSEWKVFSFRT